MEHETVLLIGGLYHLGLAGFHLLFPRLFGWSKDLASLTTINRNVMKILNLCLTTAFLIFAYVSLFHARELVSSGLGRGLLVAIALFWLLRAVEQVVFFGVKNKISIAFVFLFLVGTILYSIPLVD